jgi:hypothetical protein
MTGRTTLVTVPGPEPSGTVSLAVAPASPRLRPSAVRDVTVRLWRLRAHLDGRRAKYALRVENRSETALVASTYAFSVGRSGELGPAVPVAVPASGSLEITFPLQLPRKRPVRAVTEIRLADETFVVEESARPRRAPWLPLAGLALAATLAWFLESGFARPSVTALAAPRDVKASRPFAVAYALARAQDAEYTVVSAGGFEAARGTLVPDGTSFDVALPSATVAQAYEIRVTAHSRFGDSVRGVRVLAEPDPARAPLPARPRVSPKVAPARPAFAIDRLSLGSDTVAGGKSVIAYYRVSSVDGTLRLIDQEGTVRAEALLNRRGNSILLAPYVEADQDLRVVLHAAHGTAQAEKSVPVRITKARSLDDVLAAARRENNGPIALVAANVAPGEQIQVGIVHYEPGMRVALVDPQGQEVAASAVEDDQNEVSLTAPAIAGRADYTVTATFKNGESEETIIRNVTIGGPAEPAPAATRS